MKYLLTIIFLSLSLTVYNSFAKSRDWIEPYLRSLGFTGKVEIYNGVVPCVGSLPVGKKDGCCDLDQNIIRINSLLTKKRLEYVINHEYCHWRWRIINEKKTDDCALLLSNNK